MGKTSEATGIVQTLKDILIHGVQDTKFLGSLFRASGIKDKDIAAFLLPGIIDGEDALFAEKKLYDALVADDDFRTRMDNLLFHTQKEKLVEKIKRGVLVGTKQISTLEVTKDGGYWHVLLNGEKLLRIKEKGVSRYWSHIYEIAQNKKSELDEMDKAKGVLSWFNSNESNPIYKKGGYKKTKLLRYKSDFLYADSGIAIKKLSERRLKAARKFVK